MILPQGNRVIMKKLFATFLIFCFFIIILPHQSKWEIFGVSFKIPVIGINTKIILITGCIILILLFFYLTFQEAEEKNIKNRYKNEFRKSFIHYIQSKNGQKIENLNQQFAQIQTSQDIYYQQSTLIIKTSNIINNGKHEFPGYILSLGRVRFLLVYFIYGFKAVISLKVIPYSALLVGFLSVLILLSYKLITMISSLWVVFK